MEKLTEFLLLLIPLLVIQLGLQIFAIVDIVRKRQTKNLSPLIWIVIVICSQVLGSVLYFVLGRAEIGKSGGDDDI